MSDVVLYHVPGMSCGHCKMAVEKALNGVAGVEGVEVDLDTKRVEVRGDQLEDGLLRAAIVDAGYEAQ